MDKNTIWKWLILVALLAASLAVVWPPMPVKDADGNVLRPGKIRLGLDLKGGTSFAVKIDAVEVEREVRSRALDMEEDAIQAEIAKILKDSQKRAIEVLRNRIDNLGIAEPNIFAGKDNRIIIQLPGITEEKRQDAEASIRDVAFLEFRVVHKDNAELVAALFSGHLVPQGYKLDSSGEQGVYVRDPAFSQEKRDELYKKQIRRFNAPTGFDFMLEKTEKELKTVYKPAFVKQRYEMTGENIKNASVQVGQFGAPEVSLEFNKKGSKRFAAVTKALAPGGSKNPNPNMGRRLAIVLDDTLFSSPTVQQEIYGDARITGSFSNPEAHLLANILKAGALPAPVKIIEMRSVSPTLGSDSIQSGLRAIIYGGIAVVVFMSGYYLLSGLIANIALLLNMLLLPIGMIFAAGFLGIFSRDAASSGGAIALPVLTLPGIAGILLTIGMAVDANVLIFERIREESKTGKRLWSSITAGYDRAFVTILDANLTTMLTGVILFLFGSGPIRGFAVTLCAGIMASMFTALVVTKLFFQLLANYTPLKTLKMLTIIGKTSIDFVGKRRVAAVISLAVILVSWGLMVNRGVGNASAIFGVDFLGGSSVTLTFDQEHMVSIETVRETLSDSGVVGTRIQYQQEMEIDGDSYLHVVTALEDGSVKERPAAKVVSALVTAFPESKFEIAQEELVGPQIGKELRGRALLAIVCALIGIIIYISIRFEFGFALGAIVALTHDVLVTVGIYALCGRQLSLPIVAALLTIVGYSVNDTIVVFDRIREDLKLMRGEGFKGICNLSINQTLSRTLLTSTTTLIAVVMLLVFGGGAINDFALALFIGVLVGTYSSIFVATPVVLLWHRDKRPEFTK